MKKLFRNQKRKYFGGVCEGLGDYSNLDPILWRIVFILSMLYSLPVAGIGVTTYLGMWIFIKGK
jgi:phage shock protein C